MGLIRNLNDLAEKTTAWLERQGEAQEATADNIDAIRLIFDETKATIAELDKTYENNDDKSFKTLGALITLAVGGLYLGRYLYSLIDWSKFSVWVNWISVALVAMFGSTVILLLGAAEELFEAAKVRKGKAAPDFAEVIRYYSNSADKSQAYLLKLLTNTCLSVIDMYRKTLDNKAELIGNAYRFVNWAIYLTMVIAVLLMLRLSLVSAFPSG